MDVIESMWDYLAKPDNVILAVEVPGDPVPIDINDWQYLMPPIVPVGPYTKESVNEIIDQLQEPGTYYMGKLPSHVVQMHFSAIVPSMIRQLVPMFDKNGNQFEQSLILASKLAPRILAYQEEVNF